MHIQIPKLRFPEFSDKWYVKKLGEITAWTSGGTPSKENAEYWNGDIPWISASSMRGIKYYDSNIKITEKGLKKGSKLTKKGTLLILVRGSMLFNTIPIGLAMRDLAFNQDVKAIEVSEESTSNFILYWFISNEGKVLNMVTGTGIGAGKLDLPDLKQLQISLPQLPEQTKISNFLTVIDEKIQALKQKKSLLEQYKKGIMQQIFSQERNAARLRFKNDDGSDFDDWEEKSLGEIASKKSSNISANKIEENFGDFIIYGAAGILKRVDFYEEENDYVSIVKDGAGAGRLLFCKGKSSVLGTMEIIKPKFGVNTYFLFYLLSTFDFTKYVTGSTIPHIYFKDYSLEICGLPSRGEQQKIASFLTAIDEKIEKVNQQITATETYKKGLLQQMFI